MCTLQKRGTLYILTLTGKNDEHLLNPNLITTIQSHLTQIKSDFNKSKSPSALITTAEGKFFSNGFDVAGANSSPNPYQYKQLIESQFQTLISELICFPMPTIAAVPGHASAAGLFLAMAHDYIVMRRDRGFLYMNELDIGLVIPTWMMALVKCKIGSSAARRMVLLTAVKMVGEVGREIGLVDAMFDGVEGTVVGAVEMAEEIVKKGWDGEVYGEIRKRLLKDVLDCIGFGEDQEGKLKRLRANM